MRSNLLASVLVFTGVLAIACTGGGVSEAELSELDAAMTEMDNATDKLDNATDKLGEATDKLDQAVLVESYGDEVTCCLGLVGGKALYAPVTNGACAEGLERTNNYDCVPVCCDGDTKTVEYMGLCETLVDKKECENFDDVAQAMLGSTAVPKTGGAGVKKPQSMSRPSGGSMTRPGKPRGGTSGGGMSRPKR